MNPANVPQLRPIESFWASIKRELRKKDNIAAGINQFHQIWGVVSRNFMKTVVQKFMRNVRTKLRKYCDQLEDDAF